jgi:CRISPR/Cas system-associated exonuclease Cas4 (RecB family)
VTVGKPPLRPDTLHVSFSQVTTYLLCPEKFNQAYVKGRLPAHRAPALVFGSAIHEALAWYHECLMAGTLKPSLADLSRVFDIKFAEGGEGPIPVMWDGEEGRERLAKLGREVLGVYHETSTPYRVLAVEKAFSIVRTDSRTGEPHEEMLSGVVDLVEQDADGTIYITELKTSARRFDDIRLRCDHQVSVYSAARSALGFPDAKLRFRVLLKTKKPSIETYEVQRDELQVAETGRVIDQVLRAVDMGIFYPVRGWQCAACPYRATCGS